MIWYINFSHSIVDRVKYILLIYNSIYLNLETIYKFVWQIKGGDFQIFVVCSSDQIGLNG